MHNLLGDTNVVGVHLEGGRPVYTHEVEGDTVSDVLSYVEYDPKELINKFRTFAEQAVAEGKYLRPNAGEPWKCSVPD